MLDMAGPLTVAQELAQVHKSWDAPAPRDMRTAGSRAMTRWS